MQRVGGSEMKPHIHLLGRTSNGHFRWVCAGAGFVGHGISPKFAYSQWRLVAFLEDDY